MIIIADSSSVTFSSHEAAALFTASSWGGVKTIYVSNISAVSVCIDYVHSPVLTTQYWAVGTL